MLHIKSFVFNPVQENTYVIYNEFNDCIIIDPGCYFDDEKESLYAFLTENSLKPQMLLNTHCHLDHVFGNKYISEKFGLKLHIHAGEKPVLDFAPASGLMYDLPFDNYMGELVFLEDKQLLTLGNDKLEVIFTPGHSPASISFYSKVHQFIISGDVLFYRSIGRTDLPGGDQERLLKSIRERLFTLPGETLVYSGHGPVTNIADEKAENPFLQ